MVLPRRGVRAISSRISSVLLSLSVGRHVLEAPELGTTITPFISGFVEIGNPTSVPCFTRRPLRRPGVVTSPHPPQSPSIRRAVMRYSPLRDISASLYPPFLQDNTFSASLVSASPSRLSRSACFPPPPPYLSSAQSRQPEISNQPFCPALRRGPVPAVYPHSVSPFPQDHTFWSP